MRYPDFLKKNDTIGFVAPSFGCTIEPYKTAFEHGIDRFRGEGYGIKLGPNCFKSDGVGISSRPENCAKEFVDMWCDKETNILLSCGGGELMCEILPYVDFDALKAAKPKWFMGYSDNTNLGFLLVTLCDTASIYGPNGPAFGMEPRHLAVSDAFDLLCGRKLKFESYDGFELESHKDETKPLQSYNITEPTTLRFAGAPFESFSGRFVGGCLDCLANMCGTKYDRVKEFVEKYKDDGIIWFIESCELGIMGVRRALWQLEQAGWFKYVKGFVIGRPMLFEIEDYGMDRYSAAMSVLEKYNVPVVQDVDLGHLPPAMPFINGGYGTVRKAGEKKISVEYELK